MTVLRRLPDGTEPSPATSLLNWALIKTSPDGAFLSRLFTGIPATAMMFKNMQTILFREAQPAMVEYLCGHGYPALFLLSFLAATILPLGSEWLLAALVVQGLDPVLSVTVATAGNTLGACTTFAIGLYGGPFLIERVLRISAESRCKAEKLYGKYGVWSILFSWVPVVGDPLCLVAGVLRVRFGIFVVLVLIGKLARYGIISLMAAKYHGL